MTMNDEWQIQNQINANKWFLGNQEAIDFINGLFYCIELWDDLIDKDEEITDFRVNECMTWLFLNLPSNNWFISNRNSYLPIMKLCINAFKDANIMANNKQKHIRNLAFHLRNMGIELHIMTAYLVGGEQHLRGVSIEIREFYAFETFKEWSK